MGRSAAWRRGPNDPAVARRWLMRPSGDLLGNPKEKRSEARLTWLSLGILSVYLPLCGVLAAALPHARLAAAALSLALPIALVVHGQWWRTKPPVDPASAEPEDAFEVRLFVLDRKGLPTGRDRGLLLFCGGWLLFEGARTSFAVTQREATGRLKDGRLSLVLEDGRRTLLLPEGELAKARELENGLTEWKRSPIPEGEAVLPPTAVHPEIRASRWAFSIVGILTSSLLAMGAAMMGSWAFSACSIAVGFVCLIAARASACRLREDAARVLPSSALAFSPSSPSDSLGNGA